MRGQLRHREGLRGVTIGSVEKFITDTALSQGWVKPIQPGASGAGASASSARGPPDSPPPSSSAARLPGRDLRSLRSGRRPAGLRHPQLQAREGDRAAPREAAAQSAVTFHLDSRSAATCPSRARSRHDAVLIASRRLQGARHRRPGVGLPGSTGARLPHRLQPQRAGRRGARLRHGARSMPAKHVVVIGGGDTAMDCVAPPCASGPVGACLYRRDRNNMPGSQREVTTRRGGRRRVRLALPPRGVPRRAAGGSAVRARAIHLGVADSTADRRRSRSTTATSTSRADLPKALGFDPEDVPALGAPDLAVTRWGTLTIDPAA